jgi:hypothetical protein
MNKHAWASENTREYYEKETQIVKVGEKHKVMNKYEILRQKIQEYAASLAVQADEDKKNASFLNERNLHLAANKLSTSAETKQRICDDLLDIIQSIV